MNWGQQRFPMSGVRSHQRGSGTELSREVFFELPFCDAREEQRGPRLT